jgi:hypothetical protein
MVLTLTVPEREAALLEGGSDLRFLLQKNDVDEELQAFLYHSKITTLARFTGFVKDADELKQVFKDEFGIDSAAGLATRLRVTNAVIAFNTALQRVLKQDEVEGELGAKNLIKPMATNEWTAMRDGWQKKYWPLDDDVIPARTYLERKAEEVEQNEYKAESLTSVITKEEEDPDVLIPVWSSSGSLTMRKGAQQIDEPRNPEQLRRRLKVMGLAIMFLGLKHTNQKYLQGYTPQTTEDYLTYLLSEHCFYLQGKSAEGYAIAGPSWAQLLIYEQQIRRKAWAGIQAGTYTTFVEALKISWTDPCVKERYFITPVALSSATTSSKVRQSSEGDGMRSGKQARTTRTGKGSSKGKPKGGGGKGAGKGGKASERLGMSSKTPDGQNICYGYNDWNTRCKNKKCNFLHVCGKCFEKHPLYACKPGGQAETRSSAE